MISGSSGTPNARLRCGKSSDGIKKSASSRENRGLEVCGSCLRLAYNECRLLNIPCDPTEPTIDRVKKFVSEHGEAAASEYYGIIYDTQRLCRADDKSDERFTKVINPIGHQQFKVCVLVVNNVFGPDQLLDASCPMDSWLLLSSRTNGTATNKSGEIISSDILRRIFDLIREEKTDHRCQILRSELQIKNFLDAKDILHCSPRGCVLHDSAEAVIRLCRMHGIPLGVGMISDAFHLQCELANSRRAHVRTHLNAQHAFASILDHTIDEGKCINGLICKMFDAAFESKSLKQSLISSGFTIENLCATINNWIRLVDPNHGTYSLDDCFAFIVRDMDLAVSVGSLLIRFTKRLCFRHILISLSSKKI